MIRQTDPVQPLPDAAVQPDPSLHYRLLFDCRRTAEKEDGVNPGLSHLARLINLFEAAGILAGRLDLAAVLHGPTTRAALEDGEYRRRFDRTNPDAPIVRELAANGVKIYVCGQSVIEQKFDRKRIDPALILASSALAVLANFQLNGYALMSY